ncbi:hypothetical protein EV360DRAFT_35433 [Lentinula raphanica]|nr:hypothetical protein EV360DRAFT_35433 [Lentinula raphanica]
MLARISPASTGRPAQDVKIKLQQYEEIEGSAFVFNPLAEGETDSDGCTNLLPPTAESAETKDLLNPGLYKMIFRTTDSHCQ